MESTPRLPGPGEHRPYEPPGAALGAATTEADATPPRPGWANALGIAHILAAIFSSLMMIIAVVYAVILSGAKPDAEGPIFLGMEDRRFLWFALVDAGSGLVLNGFTFASGLALVNLRAWGARVWRWLAPAKIGRLVVVWGGFIVAVAPVLASAMGRMAAQMMRGQMRGRGGMPNAAQLALVYSWMFLAMGIGMIVLGSIYPATAWWLARRRGIAAALAGPPAGDGAAGPAGGASSGEARPS